MGGKQLVGLRVNIKFFRLILDIARAARVLCLVITAFFKVKSAPPLQEGETLFSLTAKGKYLTVQLRTATQNQTKQFMVFSVAGVEGLGQVFNQIRFIVRIVNWFLTSTHRYQQLSAVRHGRKR